MLNIDSRDSRKGADAPCDTPGTHADADFTCATHPKMYVIIAEEGGWQAGNQVCA